MGEQYINYGKVGQEQSEVERSEVEWSGAEWNGAEWNEAGPILNSLSYKIIAYHQIIIRFKFFIQLSVHFYLNSKNFKTHPSPELEHSRDNFS